MSDQKGCNANVSTTDEVALLLQGEKVVCSVCGKGIYQPFGTKETLQRHILLYVTIVGVMFTGIPMWW